MSYRQTPHRREQYRDFRPIGASSVRYEVGLFSEDVELASAHGHFVHLYVDRNSRRAVPIDDALRSVLEQILVG